MRQQALSWRAMMELPPEGGLHERKEKQTSVRVTTEGGEERGCSATV